MADHGPFFLHPLNLICAFIGLQVVIGTLGFTPASARTTRTIASVIGAGFCFAALLTTNRGTHEGQSFAEAMFAVAIHGFGQLALEPRPSEAPASAVTFWQKLRWAYFDGFTLRRRRQPTISVPSPEVTPVKGSNSRSSATSFSSSNGKTARHRAKTIQSATNRKRSKTPPLTLEKPSHSKASSKSSLTSRRIISFIPNWRLYRLAKSVIHFTAFNYLRTSPLFPFLPPPTYYDFLPKPPLLLSLYRGELDLHTLLLRIEIVGTSLIMPSLALCGVHNLCAFLFGGPGDDDVAAWPGLYGSLGEAWTVGRWYSHLWHTLMRRAFTLPCRMMAQALLGEKAPQTDLGRAFITIAAFAISGVMHTLTSWSPGPCANMSWYELVYHLAMGVVIVLEKMAIDFYLSWRRRSTGGKALPRAEVRFWTAFGYLWTALWWLEVFGAGVLYPWIICRAEAAAGMRK